MNGKMYFHCNEDKNHSKSYQNIENRWHNDVMVAF